MQDREKILDSMKQPWDIIVVGGGITGAGILREAAVRGLRCLLLEQKDFAWGTSSRSGKLVHGGLRYLKQGQVKTTWHSVRERERLLNNYTGLVEPLGFLFPTYRERPLDPFLMGLGIAVYDLMAIRRSRNRYNPSQMAFLAPGLRNGGMTGGLYYRDARTDDARLVLRVIKEGVDLGGTALNYARVENILRNSSGRVVGVAVKDQPTGREMEVLGQAVINAAGVWSDEIRSRTGSPPLLRPLRGSHLIFPGWRLPLAQAVSFMHPEDGRPVYILPWEGVTLLGTTDVDHNKPLDREPFIDRKEGQYLLNGVRAMFPALNLTAEDVISTFSGVRPVVASGQKDPSRESRDYVVRAEEGLITVTGGKLTTFNLLAREALRQAGKYIKTITKKTAPQAGGIPAGAGELTGQAGKKQALRLSGRYGPWALQLIKESRAKEFEPVPGTEILWAELVWAARHEGVVHLEDLMLRRVRLGNIIKEGGAGLLESVREIVQPVLAWDDAKWIEEERRYIKLWDQAYSPYLILG